MDSGWVDTIVGDATAIISVCQPLPHRTLDPILPSASRADVPRRGLQVLDTLRDLLTSRDVVPREFNKGTVESFNALWSDGREFGARTAREMLAAGALKEDRAEEYSGTHLENITANDVVEEADLANIGFGVERSEEAIRHEPASQCHHFLHECRY